MIKTRKTKLTAFTRINVSMATYKNDKMSQSHLSLKNHQLTIGGSGVLSSIAK